MIFTKFICLLLGFTYSFTIVIRAIRKMSVYTPQVLLGAFGWAGFIILHLYF